MTSIPYWATTSAGRSAGESVTMPIFIRFLVGQQRFALYQPAPVCMASCLLSFSRHFHDGYSDRLCTEQGYERGRHIDFGKGRFGE